MARTDWRLRPALAERGTLPEAMERHAAPLPATVLLKATLPGPYTTPPVLTDLLDRLSNLPWAEPSVALLDIPDDHDHDHDHAAEGSDSLSGSSTVSGTSTAPATGAVRTVQATGNQGIDGLLWGTCWADATITYCAPDSVDDYDAAYPNPLVGADGTVLISQLSLKQLDAARFVLDADPSGALSAAAGFSVEGLTGLRISAAPLGTGEATLAMVNHSATPTASAYYPNASPTGSGGDSFFGKGGKLPTAGNYDWKVFLHELGHALGLKHGQETSVFGAMPAELDSMEFSVMTYRSYVGKSLDVGYTNEAWGYAQTFMMYDIAALQHLYGADYGTNAGDTTYRWTPASGDTLVDGVVAIRPGANRVFLTIWDGGGTDTYDLSAYATNLRVDLSPGGHSVLSTTQLADLDQFSTDPARVARGNVFNALLYGGDTRSLIENAVGGAGHDTIAGNAVANLLRGGAGNDALLGLLGADRLEGGDGDDLLTGGAGADALCGDAGIDTACYDAAATVSLDGSILATGEALGDTFLLVENLLGSSGADRLRGDAGANVLMGEGGDDLLDGMAGADTLLGGDGNDRLDGGSGSDRMEGGAGNDTFIVADAADMVVEGLGAGLDQVNASVSHTLAANVENLLLVGTAAINGTGNSLANRIEGNGAANALRGGEGGDTLLGAAGNDLLDGEGGTDRLEGGAGDDTYVLATSGDTVVEAVGAGLDHVRAGYGYTLGANLENLTLTGTAAINGYGNALANRIVGNAAGNVIQGLDGADRLEGGAGNDSLSGGAGDDRLIGGAGADSLSGGTGLDSFVFLTASESSPVTSTRDTIADFLRGSDRIVVSAVDANQGLLGDQAFRLDTDRSFSAGEIRQTVTSSGLVLEFNTNADTTVEMALLLTGILSPLAATDFEL
jgi:serralysin